MILIIVKLFGTIGDRNSVGFTSAITINDTINSLTQNYSNRTLSADQYRNWGMESRLITDYQLGKTKNTFSGGIRFFLGNTKWITANFLDSKTCSTNRCTPTKASIGK